MGVRDRVQKALDRRPPAERVLKAPAKERWAAVRDSWEKATSFARSMTSRAMHGRCPTMDERVRRVSCCGLSVNSEMLIPPCPALTPSKNQPGSHFCNECGCGDRDIALIDPPDGYPKIAFPFLECPRRRDGFSNAIGPHFAHEPSDDDLRHLFDRVVVINLDRRADRWERFQNDLPRPWPLKEPTLQRGVDGQRCPPPKTFAEGRGAWGCLQSHRQALESALNDGLHSVLILEDDACFRATFRDELARFMRRVPASWDCLMLGGGHIGFPEKKPVVVNDEVLRCVNCQRMHAYAVRGPFMEELYRELSAASGHCDHAMGPFAAKWNTYAPTRFIVGQDGGPSDISGRVRVMEWWDEPLSVLMEE